MPQCRVLIVEDDQSIRNLLSVAATRWGFATEACGTGADAIARIGDGSDFDVVVLDLMMPVTSGYDVILYIREKQLPVPVIVVTAVVRNLELDRLDPGVVRAVLRKPFDLDRLSEAIASACRARRTAGRSDAGPLIPERGPEPEVETS